MFIPRCHRELADPRIVTPIRPVPQETADGPALRRPWTPIVFDHGLQVVPSNQRCQRWVSPPRAKTSSRLGPQVEAPGPSRMGPPSVSQLPQVVPLSDRCQRLPSPPRMKTSVLPFAATADGFAERTPPRDSQLLQALALNDRCQSAVSVPRTNTSSRFGPQDDSSGPDPIGPPSGSQWETNFRPSSFQRSFEVPSYPSAHIPAPRMFVLLTRSYL